MLSNNIEYLIGLEDGKSFLTARHGFTKNVFMAYVFNTIEEASEYIDIYSSLCIEQAYLYELKNGNIRRIEDQKIKIA